MTKKILFCKFAMSAAALIYATVLDVRPALAGDAPVASKASPDVYKVIAENNQFRVLEATWKPGQKDNFHSHPPDRVSLIHTNCKLRFTKPDGTYRDGSPKAGKAIARTGKPVGSHSAQNIGDKICVIRIVELKK